jgi:hypothetical protein
MNPRSLFAGITIAVVITACFLARSYAVPKATFISEAPSRTSGENYKDMLLARCLAQSYQSSPQALRDASATASVLVEWTYYDADTSADATDDLIHRYLARDYTHPLIEYKGVRFDLLKCLDMYHSSELAMQVGRYVGKTWQGHRKDIPTNTAR